MNQTSETPLLPGMKPVLELLRTDPQRIDLVFCKKGLRTRDAQDVQQLCRQSGVRFSLVDQAALDRLCREAAQQNGNDAAPLNHQGVVARLTATDFRDLADVLQAAAEAPLPLVVALDQVQDPGNVGTLCRTLYALGGAGVILPRHNSAYLGPAAHRAAADAFEHAMQLPAVLVLGNEDKGLRPGVAKRCGRMLRIPLARKFDSLNVAQAGAILLGLAAMRRQG